MARLIKKKIINAILNKTITIWMEEMGLMTPYKLTNIQELKKINLSLNYLMLIMKNRKN